MADPVNVKKKRTFLFFHRGYRGVPAKKHVRMVYLTRYANFYLPRSFSWNDPANRKGVREYIDALITRDIDTAQRFEANGMVSEQVFEDPPPNVPIVAINPDRLRTILRGEDPLEVPADAQLVWCGRTTGTKARKKHAGRYVPLAIMAELLSGELEDLQRDYISERINATARSVTAAGSQ